METALVGVVALDASGRVRVSEEEDELSDGAAWANVAEEKAKANVQAAAPTRADRRWVKTKSS